ncbi:NUDIX domain-containing protein [Thioalkalivibrio sp. ALgr1]|uniref:NUDIX hydrolase n=1 Tax=Thioalkalivibrio sp. ALgr1 TaxID=748655 RepID=UPI000372F5D4|nr:NUDIX domain-containing protein [Thioalkalivibrio sp. ALgr1]
MSRDVSIPRPEFHRAVPENDDRERKICSHCGFVDYENPRIVVGVVATWEGRVLLCRRAIEPRKGHWTLPAGYMELGESTEQGAEREAWEEARARLRIDRLLAVYSLPHIGQVQMIYRAELLGDDVAPGPESEEVALFDFNDLPGELAFPSVAWALAHYQQTRHLNEFAPMGAPESASPLGGL